MIRGVVVYVLLRYVTLRAVAVSALSLPYFNILLSVSMDDKNATVTNQAIEAALRILNRSVI